MTVTLSVTPTTLGTLVKLTGFCVDPSNPWQGRVLCRPVFFQSPSRFCGTILSRVLTPPFPVRTLVRKVLRIV
jgi:hypothetical protein